MDKSSIDESNHTYRRRDDEATKAVSDFAEEDTACNGHLSFVEMVASESGDGCADVNSDIIVDGTDIDIITGSIYSGSTSVQFDFDGDTILDETRTP